MTYWDDPTIYARHGLRRLTYDRPAYGESTRPKGRPIADVVADVAAISEALGVDRFVVSGGSGGGPPAKAIVTVLMPSPSDEAPRPVRSSRVRRSRRRPR